MNEPTNNSQAGKGSSLSLFQEDEILKGFQSFKNRFLQYKKHEIRNKTIYTQPSSEDEEGQDEQDGDQVQFIDKKDAVMIIESPQADKKNNSIQPDVQQHSPLTASNADRIGKKRFIDKDKFIYSNKQLYARKSAGD